MTAGSMAMPPSVLWPVGVILAALLGSFLNVCISRLPRGESVVLPASHCPGCRTPIRARDNIPVVSFLVLRGRCRACRTPISWRYPLVELGAVALGILVLWWLGPTWAAARVFVLALALLAVTVTDFETRRIPDRITLPGVIAGLVLAPEGLSRGSAGALLGALAFGLITTWRSRAEASRPPTGSPDPGGDPEDDVSPAERRRLDVLWAAAWGGLLGRQLAVVDLDRLTSPGGPIAWRLLGEVDAAVAGCLVTGGLFFLVAWMSHLITGRTGLGGGDVKLAGLIGAFLGVGGGLVAAFVGIVLGGVTALALLVLGLRRFGEYLAFGPFLAAGGFVAALWGPALLEWYLG
jgi:prepilin signal peptidase PulO-like enzyme (type II secretory pathway)